MFCNQHKKEDNKMTDQLTEAVPLTRDQIQAMLKTGPHVVSFYKLDGTIRDMTCTLAPEDLPPVVVKEGDKPKRVKKPNDAVLAAFDTNKQAWRSFRIENVFDVVAS